MDLRLRMMEMTVWMDSRLELAGMTGCELMRHLMLWNVKYLKFFLPFPFLLSDACWAGHWVGRSYRYAGLV